MTRKEIAQKLLQEGEGILRLTPTWVPRSFCRPGRRIKLHPDDYYALGLSRGGIDERWFASTTHAENGPGTPDDEGLSYVVSADDSEKMLLREMVSELGADVIGEFLWNKYHRWPAYSKFFDNLGPLPHHIHQRDEHAALTGQAGKPEMYFFPAQVNNYRGERAETYFGLNPGTTKEELKQIIKNTETITIEVPLLPESVLQSIKALEHVYQATYEQEELKIYCSGGVHNLVDVLHILQEQQVAIGRVYTTLPTLNDVFLEITGKALRDQEG